MFSLRLPPTLDGRSPERTRGGYLIELLAIVAIAAVSFGLVIVTHIYVLALVPALAIIALLFLGNFPTIGYYAIVFLIPFSAFRNLGGPFESVQIHWIVAFFLLVIAAFRLLFRKDFPRNLTGRIWIIFTAIFVVALLSCVFSPYKETAFTNLWRLVLAYLFIALGYIFVDRRAFHYGVPFVLVLSISIGSFLAVLGYIGGIEMLAHDPDTEATRATGATINPNNMAMMIVFCLPMIFFWMFQARRPSMRLLATGALALNLAGLVTTFSRGGGIVTLVILGGLLFETRRRIRPTHLGLLAALLAFSVAIVAATVPQSYWQRAENMFSPKTDRAMQRRTSYIAVSWNTFKHRPIIGAGLGTFQDIYASTAYARELTREEESPRRAAHNTYLEMIVGTGFIGLIAFLVLLAYCLKILTQAKRNFLARGDTEMAFLVACYRLSFFGLVVYFLIKSGFDHKYFLVALTMAHLAWCYSRRPAHEEEPADDALAVA